MECLDKGHRYRLRSRGAFPGVEATSSQVIQFVNREPGRESDGTTTQEVIRALIDRTWYCNDCLPFAGNLEAIKHLRQALMWHEVRAMLKKVEDGELEPEFLMLGNDGHFALMRDHCAKPSPYARMPDTGTSTGSLKPGICSHQKMESEAALPEALKTGIPSLTTDEAIQRPIPVHKKA